MVFAIYFFVSWLTTFIFVLMPKKLSFIENSFIYLFTLVISMNWSWFVYQEWGLIKLTTKPMFYTAFIINRSIAVPLIIVITMNLILFSPSVGRTILYLVASASLLLLLASGGIYFHITKYLQWNAALDFTYFLILNSIGYLCVRFLRFMEKKEVHGH
ncbi:hypothetical protein [Bacillus sp. B1-b2]|uniref:hypothetical protein n=1 Tax=Bacillus sp. B1-b2 TaxID=2653201 RepID=UPI00126288B6|nr:hypothetical protein [Bacillus sp. B1-b2]KAB7671252.1 hypothetical protein F9279_07000 [Bacillus sp. B1-b2]